MEIAIPSSSPSLAATMLANSAEPVEKELRSYIADEMKKTKACLMEQRERDFNAAIDAKRKAAEQARQANPRRQSLAKVTTWLKPFPKKSIHSRGTSIEATLSPPLSGGSKSPVSPLPLQPNQSAAVRPPRPSISIPLRRYSPSDSSIDVEQLINQCRTLTGDNQNPQSTSTLSKNTPIESRFSPLSPDSFSTPSIGSVSPNIQLPPSPETRSGISPGLTKPEPRRLPLRHSKSVWSADYKNRSLSGAPITASPGKEPLCPSLPRKPCPTIITTVKYSSSLYTPSVYSSSLRHRPWTPATPDSCNTGFATHASVYTVEMPFSNECDPIEAVVSMPEPSEGTLPAEPTSRSRRMSFSACPETLDVVRSTERPAKIQEDNYPDQPPIIRDERTGTRENPPMPVPSSACSLGNDSMGAAKHSEIPAGLVRVSTPVPKGRSWGRVKRRKSATIKRTKTTNVSRTKSAERARKSYPLKAKAPVTPKNLPSQLTKPKNVHKKWGVGESVSDLFSGRLFSRMEVQELINVQELTKAWPIAPEEVSAHAEVVMGPLPEIDTSPLRVSTIERFGLEGPNGGLSTIPESKDVAEHVPSPASLIPPQMPPRKDSTVLGTAEWNLEEPQKPLGSPTNAMMPTLQAEVKTKRPLTPPPKVPLDGRFRRSRIGPLSSGRKIAHGPIRLRLDIPSSSKEERLRKVAKENLDWTAFQIAIGGPTGDYLMGGDNDLSESDYYDDVVTWFDSFHFYETRAGSRSRNAPIPVDLPALEPPSELNGRTSRATIESQLSPMREVIDAVDQHIRMSSNLNGDKLEDFLSFPYYIADGEE